MFGIRLCYDKNSVLDSIGIKCNNSDKVTSYTLRNEEINEDINIFVLHIVIQHVELSWIINNNKHLRFNIEKNYATLMRNSP